MGCQVSTGIVVAPEKELTDYLSDRDIELVRRSWELLAEDMDEFGMLIFHRLMQSEKEVKSLFKKMLVVVSRGEEVLDDEKLGKHAQIVMQGLGAAVESLDDSIYLSHILIAMGIRHAAYGVKPYMFQYLWQAVEFALQRKLGVELEAETHKAWETVFLYLASKMSQGIKVGESRDRDEIQI